jgi:hypothetical protein
LAFGFWLRALGSFHRYRAGKLFFAGFWVEIIPVHGLTFLDPTHRDEAAMNGAQPFSEYWCLQKSRRMGHNSML